MLTEGLRIFRRAYGLLRMTGAEVIAVTLQSLRVALRRPTAPYTRVVWARRNALEWGRVTAPLYLH